MPDTAQITLPRIQRAGDSFSWRQTLGEHTAANGWALTLRLIPQAGAPVQITGSATGPEWAFAATPAQTAAWPAVAYTAALIATRADERTTLASGSLTVQPDLATSATHDSRSFARKMLDAIEAALIGRATNDELDLISITVYSRGQTRSQGELLAARNKFLVEVQREEAAAGRGRSGRVYMRF
jgi:hypothetical protein